MGIQWEEHVKPDYQRIARFWQTAPSDIHPMEAFYRSLPQEKDVKKVRSSCVRWLLYEKPRRDARALAAACALGLVQVIIRRTDLKSLNDFFKAMEWNFDDPEDVSQGRPIRRFDSMKLVALHDFPTDLVLGAAVQPEELIETVLTIAMDWSPETFSYPSDTVSYNVLQDVGHEPFQIVQEPSMLSPNDEKFIDLAQVIRESNPKHGEFLDLVVDQRMPRKEAAQKAGLNRQALKDIRRKAKRLREEKAVRIRADSILQDEQDRGRESEVIRRDRQERIIAHRRDAGWSLDTAKHHPEIVETFNEAMNYLLQTGKKKPRSEKHRRHGRQYRWDVDPDEGLRDKKS